MPAPTADAPTVPPTSISSSCRLPRMVGKARELTTLEQRFLHEALELCERTFEQSLFFRRLADEAMTPAALKYVFGQYGHFRLQLHRWFAICIMLVTDASRSAQRQAILALADHIFTDLEDDHDRLFAECLHDIGFPVTTLYAPVMSSATIAYIESFLDDCRAGTVTWLEAMAALGRS